MKKPYKVSNLFFTQWKELGYKRHAEVFRLHLDLSQLKPGTLEYGLGMIALLRQLRRRPLLVDKINEEQVPDIFNEIKVSLLSKPWYLFPKISRWRNPVEKMAQCSFDQFIYADNEFTSYLATQDEKYINRLAFTLYLRSGERLFNKEHVEKRAAAYTFKIHELQLIFFTFMHVREFVVKRCKYLLPPGAASEDNKAKASGPMWHEIKHSAAKTLVFGNFQTLGEANMYDVLDHLNLLAKHNEHANA